MQIAAYQRNRTRKPTFSQWISPKSEDYATFAVAISRIGAVTQCIEDLPNPRRRFEKSNGIVTQLRFHLAFCRFR